MTIRTAENRLFPSFRKRSGKFGILSRPDHDKNNTRKAIHMSVCKDIPHLQIHMLTHKLISPSFRQHNFPSNNIPSSKNMKGFTVENTASSCLFQNISVFTPKHQDIFPETSRCFPQNTTEFFTSLCLVHPLYKAF